MVLAHVIPLFSLFSAPQYLAAKAPERVITASSIEIRTDDSLFALYAAINALGYAQEIKQGPQPISSPRFYPQRKALRIALQKERGAFLPMKKYLEREKKPIENYLHEILYRKTKNKALFSALKSSFWGSSSETLASTFAKEEREVLLEIGQQLNKDEKKQQELWRLLGYTKTAPRTRVRVAYIPLESHDIVRRVPNAQKEITLVSGPGLRGIRVAVLAETILPAVQEYLAQTKARPRNLSVAFRRATGLKELGAQGIHTADAYLGVQMAHALAYRTLYRNPPVGAEWAFKLSELTLKRVWTPALYDAFRGIKQTPKALANAVSKLGL